MSLECKFQHDLILTLKERFPGCLVLKNDPNYIQGFPDLLILYNNKWAALECKSEATSKLQPNQLYYIKTLREMSYANFICPETQREVLDELQRALRTGR